MPDISKWPISYTVKSMFKDCISLESLPDISNLGISQVYELKELFCNCKSLKSLPDISKWNLVTFDKIKKTKQ